MCIRPPVPFYTLSVVEPLVEAVEYYEVTLFNERILCHVGEADRRSTEYLALWMVGVQSVKLFPAVAELSNDVFQNLYQVELRN
jgi:hypothetical protein